jgi:hypothetical protein
MQGVHVEGVYDGGIPGRQVGVIIEKGTQGRGAREEGTAGMQETRAYKADRRDRQERQVKENR